jgi:predicted GIY-YIG superfamily endonuclease
MEFLGGLLLGLAVAAGVYLSRNAWQSRALAAETEIKAAAAQAKAELVKVENEIVSAPKTALK